MQSKYIGPKIYLDNIFTMTGQVTGMLKKLGHDKSEVDDLIKKVFATSSYKEACDVLREYFPVEEENKT